jgi:Fe-S oxidoreductase
MIKEEEKGETRVNWERANEAVETGASVIAAACPFCNTMMTDGVKNFNKESEIEVLDVAELIANAVDLH